jgi:hypothetical protein
MSFFDEDQLREQLARYEEALQRIEQWSEAYPVAVFPEPDLAKAAQLLQAGGITLDSVSAHCMRHVIAGVGAIAKAALHHEGSA